MSRLPRDSGIVFAVLLTAALGVLSLGCDFTSDGDRFQRRTLV